MSNFNLINPKILVVHGDITHQKVDVIVNAANRSLLGGSGVDSAIHRVAGPELLRECATLNGCATGDAKITKGYDLPAKWVIHTVGPIWRGGHQGEEQLLASCYRRCLELAVEHELKSLAFPAISTGIYGFPLERATTIAITEVKNFLEQENLIDKVVFVCFSREAFDCYQKNIKAIL
jgi:O-acetyl-ADP-ribose deacetylase (regulator of RNase III)